MKELFESISGWAYRVRSGFNSFLYWAKLRANKKYMTLLKTVLTDYPYDGVFLLYLEKAKIEDMLYYHERHQYVADEYRERIIRTLRLASSLLGIIIDDDGLYHYTGEPETVKLEGTDLYEWKKGTLEYHCDVSVNSGNMERFTDGHEWKRNLFVSRPHELYVEKARRLYSKVRLMYTGIWWD